MNLISAKSESSMAKPKSAKRMFTDVVYSTNLLKSAFMDEGDTVWEITVVRKFKFKRDKNDDVIIPEAK